MLLNIFFIKELLRKFNLLIHKWMIRHINVFWIIFLHLLRANLFLCLHLRYKSFWIDVIYFNFFSNCLFCFRVWFFTITDFFKFTLDKILNCSPEELYVIAVSQVNHFLVQQKYHESHWNLFRVVTFIDVKPHRFSWSHIEYNL